MLLSAALLLNMGLAYAASPLVDDAVPGTYIVSFDEAPLAAFRGFEGDSDAKRAGLKATSPEVTGDTRLNMKSPAAQAYRAWLGEQRDDQLALLAAELGRTVEPSLVLDVVNNAVVLSLTASEAKRIAAMPGVSHVEAEWIHKPTTDSGPQWVGADQLWSGVDGVVTRGEGVVVGVIDTGINRTHPSFAAVGPIDGYVHTNPRGQLYGLCASNPTFCNAKLIGIHDFTICTGVHAGTGCDDREANDGLSQDLHGSHVASTAAGNRLEVSISTGTGTVNRFVSGVAPRANVIAYKACEEDENCRGSWLLAALNQAVADGVAVINYSIGGSPRDPWAASDATAMLNARNAGVVVVVAAGNDGPGVGTVSSPGNAPWVIAAANSTHDRALVNRLVDLTGGNTPPPSGGVLLGVGSTAGYGPASIVIPLDFPGCSIGSDADSPPTGATNPWTGPVFNGEIVVCARGTQARVAKSNNVRLAGGGGMVLTNTVVEGESIVADAHSIPATHVGVQAGNALRTWLSSGTGHRGRLEGAQLRSEASVADILASTSGRGPSSVPGILKPNVAAPGTSIIAAAGSGNGFAFLSGTSMATPHVAGAVALLRAARPTWTVADIESAIQSAASPMVRKTSGSGLATPFEQGGGRLDVPAALRAGLSFPLSGQALLAARPSAGGQPKALNQAALVDPACFERCSFSREVRDLNGGGRWRVEVELTSGAIATVTPLEFELAAGGSQTLQIELDVRDPRIAGQWVSGALRLHKISGAAASDARITVNAFATAGDIPTLAINSPSDRVASDVGISGLIALPDLTLAVTSVTEAVRRSENLTQDATNTLPYDSFGIGTYFSLVTVPASATADGWILVADLISTTAPDVDLFVGLDGDGDGQPDEIELLCTSADEAALERCELPIEAAPFARSYWVLAQNFRAGNTGVDAVRLTTTLNELVADPTSALTVTAPAVLERFQVVPLRLAFDSPTSASGSLLSAYVGLRAVRDAPQPFAWARVEIQRGNQTPAARALVPGRPLEMRLDGNSAADKLFLDVPFNATAMTITSSGNGEIDLFAARVANPGTPVVQSSPGQLESNASAFGPGANHTIMLAGNSLAPSRWYVMPVNLGATASTFTLDVSLTYGTSRAHPQFGAYFNPARSGSGLFVFPVGDSWGLAWYTYLEDGTPTWYLGAAPRPGELQGQWRVELLRYRWNGQQAISTPVGEGLLSLNEGQRFTYSWSLDASSGSESMEWIGDRRCPSVGGSPREVTGLWFSPEKPGFGYSVIANPDFESIGAYFYDAAGTARWSLGSIAPFGGSTLSMAWRTGACPLCAYSAPLVTPALGSLQHTYSSSAAGSFGLDFAVPAPLSGRWQVNLPATRLSDSLGCQ